MNRFLRLPRVSPLLFTAAVATISLGVAVVLTAWLIYHQVLYRTVVATDPQALVIFHITPGPFGPGGTEGGHGESVFSLPTFTAFSASSSRCFDSIAAFSDNDASVVFGTRAQRSLIGFVSGEFFQTLGITPLVGRLIRPADSTQSNTLVAVVSYAYWVHSLYRDAAIVGSTVVIDGTPAVIIGVMQPGFTGITTSAIPDVILPLRAKPLIFKDWQGYKSWTTRWLNVFGRLRHGISPGAAQSCVAGAYASFVRHELARIPNVGYEHLRKGLLAKRLLLVPGAYGINEARERWRIPLLVLLGMGMLLFVIACGNVANLCFSRAVGRTNEIAIRVALGANRLSIFAMLWREGAAISIVGTLCGVILAISFAVIGASFLPSDLGMHNNLASEMNPSMIAAALFCLMSTLFFVSIVPALSCYHLDLTGALKAGTRTSSQSHRHVKVRRLIVVGQIALAAILLFTAGLFSHSMYALIHRNTGFHPEHLQRFEIAPYLSGYDTTGSRQLAVQVQGMLTNSPGVLDCSFADVGPFGASQFSVNFSVKGSVPREPTGDIANLEFIGPRYFATLGATVLRGREIVASDAVAKNKIAVVNEAFVKRYLPGDHVLGRKIKIGQASGDPYDITIIGIVANILSNLHYHARPTVYLAMFEEQAPAPLVFFVRTANQGIAPDRYIRTLAPGIPVFGASSMDGLIYGSLRMDRVLGFVTSGFGLVASLLSTIGLYAIMSLSVKARIPEFAIRIALGASPANIIRLVMFDALRILCAAVVVASLLVVVVHRTIYAELYGVPLLDIGTLLGTLLVLGLLTLIATYVPAKSATGVDPARVLTAGL